MHVVQDTVYVVIRQLILLRDEFRIPKLTVHSDLLGRPEQPFRTGLCFTRDVFFVSPVVLRAPSTDRPETLPRDQNLAEFYNPTPKIRGALPPKNLWAKNMQNFGQFWTTFDFDREYLRNAVTYPKSERRAN